MSGIYNNNRFPTWNYGYTLGPPSASNGDNYTTVKDSSYDRKNIIESTEKEVTATKEKQNTENETKSNQSITVKSAEYPFQDPVKEDKVKKETATTKLPLEDGEVKRSLQDIWKGQHPILYCSDQSKIRKLHMEWEQIDETGPPHDKIFTWCLQLGNMIAKGSAGNKKGAKTAAAEEMVKMLDLLPKSGDRERQWSDDHESEPVSGYGQIITPQIFGQYNATTPFTPGEQESPQTKKYKSNNLSESNTAVLPNIGSIGQLQFSSNIAQNNPISKLYEYCKKIKVPEPLFETVIENVLEQKRSKQGFTINTTEYTIQCDVLGKQF